MHAYVYIYLTIYNLLSPYDVPCMYEFRADHLCWITLGREGSVPPSPTILVSHSLYSRVEPHWISLFRVNTSLSVVLVQMEFGQP